MSVEVIRAISLGQFPHGFLGRRGGMSVGECAGLNVGFGSNDDPECIAGNRRLAVAALLPEAELSGLEAELRSQSQGLATYEAEFDHLAELNGPLADKVIQQKVPEPA